MKEIQTTLFSWCVFFRLLCGKVLDLIDQRVEADGLRAALERKPTAPRPQSGDMIEYVVSPAECRFRPHEPLGEDPTRSLPTVEDPDRYETQSDRLLEEAGETLAPLTIFRWRANNLPHRIRLKL
jgi:hypothetical protein